MFTYDTTYALGEQILLLCLSHQFDLHIADRPVLSLVCSCLVAGISLLFLARFLPHIFDFDPLPASNHLASLDEGPKTPSPVSHPAGSSPRRFQGLKNLRTCTQWVVPWVGISLMSVRVELFRQAIVNYQCTSLEHEVCTFSLFPRKQ